MEVRLSCRSSRPILLLQELEKSAAPEAPAHLKPRSGVVCHERRARRGNDNRFLTQPITCEEVEIR